MKLRLRPDTLDRVGGPVMQGWCRTWRFRVTGEEHWGAPGRAGRPAVLLLWHEAILPLLWQRRGTGVALVISEARDGRHLAAFAERLGYRVVPGSSTRGGARALAGAIRVLREGGTVAFTPDGPRGPRREFKAGFLRAAQRTGALVVPMHAEARWARRLRSWDRFLLPLPGARIEVVIGAPFAVDEATETSGMAEEQARAAMAAVVGEAEWRSGVVTATG